MFLCTFIHRVRVASVYIQENARRYKVTGNEKDIAVFLVYFVIESTSTMV